MSRKRMLAIDIGAESGRAVVGTLEHERLTLSEVRRFANEPLVIGDAIHWDVPGLLRSVRSSISLARRSPLESVAIDTWGVDFGLLDGAGALVTPPRSYRDGATTDAVESLATAHPGIDPYGATGIQTRHINTLFQLWALRQRSPGTLDAAERLLMMPDLFAYSLTGIPVNELTIASTSQLVSASTRDWAWELIDQLAFPARIFGRLVAPGTTIGPLDGGAAAPVLVATASHDTAAAVVAAAGLRDDTAFVSTGSWCLVGVERGRPLVGEPSRAAGLSNELGVDGRTRLLKNVVGLWLLAESRRQWARDGVDLSYEAIVEAADRTRPLVHLFDPDEPTLLAPGDVPGRIARLCGTDSPLDPAETARAILDSIALKIRHAVDQIEVVSGATYRRLNLVGGGVRNRVLCQAVANACGRMVLAGPVEATSMGNVIVQLMAGGEVASLGEGRQLAARSVQLRAVEPADQATWEEAYGRFRELLGGHMT